MVMNMHRLFFGFFLFAPLSLAAETTFEFLGGPSFAYSSETERLNENRKSFLNYYLLSTTENEVRRQIEYANIYFAEPVRIRGGGWRFGIITSGDDGTLLTGASVEGFEFKATNVRTLPENYYATLFSRGTDFIFSPADQKDPLSDEKNLLYNFELLNQLNYEDRYAGHAASFTFDVGLQIPFEFISFYFVLSVGSPQVEGMTGIGGGRAGLRVNVSEGFGFMAEGYGAYHVVEWDDVISADALDIGVSGYRFGFFAVLGG